MGPTGVGLLDWGNCGCNGGWRSCTMSAGERASPSSLLASRHKYPIQFLCKYYVVKTLDADSGL